MAGGLAALLDDIAALAKMAAASIDDVGAAAGRASAKAAGVVVDDTAVTPRYVHGFTADRELPMIRRIALGSVRNKLVFILPVILLLSQLLPWLLTPLLMLGGTYLVFEGAEKLLEALTGAGHDDEAGRAEAVAGASGDHVPATTAGVDTERSMVSGAIRTDFILSAEIMVIALNEVAEEPFLSRTIILVLVALAITALVYGVVALIVKMDDVGLRLAETRNGVTAALGRGLVRAMPAVLSVLSTVGIVAMLWVGGHILLNGAATLGWHGPEDLVHHLGELAGHVPGVGGFLGWLVGTLGAALVGLVVGAVVVGVAHLLPRRAKGRPTAH